MTQIRSIAARPAVRALAQQLLNRLGLAVLLAFLTMTLVPAVGAGLVHHSLATGIDTFTTLASWTLRGLLPFDL